jgi:hypothetical protein
MFRIDDATAATSLPAPEAAGTEGYFTEGNPTAGTPATNVRGSWLNMIQEELCAILAAAGITRSKTSYNQVNAALQKMYSPVIGSARKLVMTVTAASAAATLTADEVVVGAALGGQKYILSSFSKTINLATTGAGGMDTGTAPVSGYVAIYAIYNPATATAALLAANATSAVAGNVYGGASMPAGYTASALVSVVPTNASGQFVIFKQLDRSIKIAQVTAFSTTTATGSPTNLSISGVVPPNAITISGAQQVGTSTNAVVSGQLYSDASGVGNEPNIANIPGAGSQITAFRDVFLAAQQTVRYGVSITAGTLSYVLFITGYTF